MPFTSPVVAGVQLVRNAIQSQNFVTGVSGWQISRNGNAEFNSGTFRGSLVIGSPGTGSGASISAAVPAVIQAHYAGKTLTQFSFLLYVDATHYHYEIVYAITTTAQVWAQGWVDTAGVHEYLNQAMILGTDNMSFSGDQPITETTLWQFGNNWGPARSPAGSHNKISIFDTSVVFGDQSHADTGSQTFGAGNAIFNGSSVQILCNTQVQNTINIETNSGGEFTFNNVSAGRGVIYESQLTNVTPSGIGLAEQLWFATPASVTFPDGRAFRATLDGQWECAATALTQNPVLAFRETNLAGVQLVKTGRVPIPLVSSDCQFGISGVFTNTTGIAVVQALALTITLQVATLVRFDGAVAPANCKIIIEDIGAASAFADKISLT